MMGPGFPKGLFELGIDYYETFDNIFYESIKFSGFIVFLAGVLLLIKRKDHLLLIILVFWCFLFFLFMIQAGYGYATHDYYTLPLVPALALGAGYALSKIKINTWRYAALSFIMLEGLLNVIHDFRIKEEHRFYTALNTFSDAYIPKAELVVCDEGMNPRMLYYLNRKGWSMDYEYLQREGVLDSLTNKGAKYFVSLNHNRFKTDLPVIATTNEITCYKLKNR
jgi:hypothetical protein